MKRLLYFLIWSGLFSVGVLGQTQQPTGDVLGAHDLSAGGTSSIKSSGGGSCYFCHAPHGGVGGATPLWSQTLSTQIYTTYSSPTAQNTEVQPTLGSDSSLCMSCHDGTVAVGTSVPYGKITMSGSLSKRDTLGTELQGSHPFSFKLPMKDSPDLVASLASSHTTADTSGSVKLVNDNVECTTCHNPHVQSIDSAAPMFLVRDNKNGGICLSCHETGTRTLAGTSNPVAGWTSSVHANAANYKVALAANFGSYETVAEFACQSCHLPHNASGSSSLLRSPSTPIPNIDGTTQSCLTCHNGGSNLTPVPPNIGLEMSKATGHPTPAGTNSHSSSEGVILQNNRHATCVDCHNAHASEQVATFTAAPTIRASQNAVSGASIPDGTTIVTPAANQYESCLRCHGTSSGKQVLAGYMPLRVVAIGDRWNVIPEFAQTSTSSHPVTHDSNSPLAQPSLRTYMLNLDGINSSPRAQGVGPGSRILCTDCHNSEDNREFGGTGPNGPHGSANLHILERRYEYTQVASGAPAGSTVSQLYTHPSLDSGVSTPGPYAMCGKCHDLSNIMSDASFKGRPEFQNRGGHFSHIDDGFSCSVCHTAHGISAQSAAIVGGRLVNFDGNVVGQVGTTPVSYSRDTNSCTLRCHGYDHTWDGATMTVQPTQP